MDQVVYVVDDAAPRLVLAQAFPAGKAKPLADMLGAGMPTSLVPVIQDASGKALRVKPCDPVPPIEIKVDGEGRGSFSTPQSPLFSSGVPCGANCVALVSKSPAGAPRMVASMTGDDAGAVWHMWFDPSLGLPDGAYMAPTPGLSAAVVPACFPAIDPGLWLMEPRHLGGKKMRYVHMTGSQAGLHVQGMEGRLPFTLRVTPDRAPIKQMTRGGTNAPGSTITGPGGAYMLHVEDGGMFLTDRASGAVTRLVDPDPSRTWIDPAFSADGEDVYLADQGDKPGLYSFGMEHKDLLRHAVWPALRRPVPTMFDRQPALGWMQDTAEGTRIGTARPMTEAEARAWGRGPVTLIDFEPLWLPVQQEGGKTVRCKAPDRIEIAWTRRAVSSAGAG